MVSNRFLVLLFFLPICLAEFPLVPDPYVVEPREDTVSYRLPTDTFPLSYEITLEPFFEPDFTFNGFVKIVIQVETSTSLITLHGHQLEINEETVVVRNQNGLINLALGAITYDEDLHFIYIPLEEQVDAGTILEIEIEYEGKLNEGNKGFYRAKYVEDNVDKWFGTTQFESTGARQAFPCYDEPALKATFTIHIIRTAAYNSISNMPLVDTEQLDDTRFQDNFEETVLMSTYLVAFVVSEMTYTDEGDHRVYAAPELIDDGRGDYALETSLPTLQAIEDFTNVNYTLPKMFQVGIPDDYFSAGAMENWGLVTYKERYLLYKQGLSTAAEKERTATVIAHEYTHQWFGNLVSPEWWSYIWLNEGFATYLEHYACSVVEPGMRMMEQIVILAHQYAMESDALATTRPMTQDAQTPAQISALFDRIAYEKGGSVIRMMEHFLTTEVFRRGLEIYLDNKKFSAATADDLWDGMQAAVDELDPEILGERTVKEIMETWELQAGFPVVNVAKNSDGEIVLSQSRFLLNGPTTETTTWTIPINYATSGEPDFANTTTTYWLTTATENTGITVEDEEWIILNKQETGFYRVNYDEENWNLIIEYLRSEDYDNIHLLNRAQLVDDAMNLARSNRLSYNITMDLLTYLSNEVDYIPLYSFFRGLTFLNKHLINTEAYDMFKEFVRNILGTAYNKLGTADTGTHTEKLNRNNVLTWLCRFEHEDCLSKMHTQLAKTAAASPDLQTVVYCSGLETDSNTDAKWNYLYNRYVGDEAEYLEKSRIISALGCTSSEEHMTKLLDLVISEDSTISSSDKVSAISGIYSNSKLGLETAFNYVLDNFDALTSSLTKSQISSVLSGISERLTTKAQQTTLKNFIDALPAETQTEYASYFETAQSNVQTNIDWADEHIDEIRVWLEVYSSGYAFTVSIPLLIVALYLHLFA